MHVVLFDIDGSLLSSGGAGKAALEMGLAEEYGITGALERMKLSGRTDTAIIRELLTSVSLPDTPDHRARVRGAYLRHLPECLARSKGMVLPGVEALLKLLQA